MPGDEGGELRGELEAERLDAVCLIGLGEVGFKR